MIRRAWVAVPLALAVAVASTAVAVMLRDREAEERAPVKPNADRATGLALVIAETHTGRFAAVVGSTGGDDAALVLPTEVQVTIPGQGDATLAEALALPGRQAATTVANLLGLWVDHHVEIGRTRLAAVVDRADGITVGDDLLDGDEVVTMMEEAGQGATATFTLVMQGLLSSGVRWQDPDVAAADSAPEVIQILEAARGASVRAVPSVEAATDVFRAEPEAVRESIVDAFGGPDREVVNVIVLNGSGVPGVGELVADRIVPEGFRIVVSENASNFNHEETLVVVGSADDVVLGERVRDLLGTGSVNVSVASGIAPVTIVVGKDFTG